MNPARLQLPRQISTKIETNIPPSLALGNELVINQGLAPRKKRKMMSKKGWAADIKFMQSSSSGPCFIVGSNSPLAVSSENEQKKRPELCPSVPYLQIAQGEGDETERREAGLRLPGE
jgi:hypothetical protein